MQVPGLMRCALICVATSIYSFAFSQNISPEEKTKAVQAIAKYVAAHYVEAEKGGQIASHIQAANHRGEFSDANSWEQFDAAVTGVMQNISGDPHLYVRFDELEAKKLKTSRDNANRMYVGAASMSADDSGIGETSVLDGNVGYLKINRINVNKKSLPEIKKAMESLSGTDAMIIDLRDNSGGGSELGAIYESFFLPSSTPLLNFTGRDGSVKTISTVDWIKENRYDKPLFIIVNKKTASAAEAFAYVLQQNKRATIVGETSAGAAYMNERFPVEEHSYVSVSTSTPHLPDTDKSWAGIGIRPDIKVKNADPLQVAKSAVYKRLRK